MITIHRIFRRSAVIWYPWRCQTKRMHHDRLSLDIGNSYPIYADCGGWQPKSSID